MKGELSRFLWYALLGNSIKFIKNQTGSNEIRQILYYINEHYNEPLTIEFLAAKTHLSKSWFMRKFHDTVGVGAIEYINKLRIQKVCEMLLDGSKIADAAFECGFQNLSNFNMLLRLWSAVHRGNIHVNLSARHFILLFTLSFFINSSKHHVPSKFFQYLFFNLLKITFLPY